MENLSSKKRVRDDSDSWELGSPEVKRIKDDLFGILDDSEFCTPSHDLDSFIKSFEEEISTSLPPPVVVEDSGESQPELGYLLEASDDELGLPPSTTSSSEVKKNHVENELARVSSESSELSELWRFNDQISSYDSFEFGFPDPDNINGGYVAIDGLFDYLDLGFGSPDSSRRPETLPAL